MALRQIRVLARPCLVRRINRAPPLRRPFLVLSTFSLPHRLPSVTASSFPSLPPLGPLHPAARPRSAYPFCQAGCIVPALFGVPQPYAVTRLAQRCWFLQFILTSPRPGRFQPSRCVTMRYDGNSSLDRGSLDSSLTLKLLNAYPPSPCLPGYLLSPARSEPMSTR